jgi:uncharacterized protein YkwD
MPRSVHIFTITTDACGTYPITQTPTDTAMATLTPDLAQAELAIVELTNAFRAEQKLGRVVPNRTLNAAARGYAEFLAKSKLFSHTADGRQHSDRAKNAGYAYCYVSENLSYNMDARGFATSQLATDALEGWKKSPGHRRNLVAPHVTDIGVGIAKTPGEETYLSVQLFGRPESFKLEFKIQNGLQTNVTYAIGSLTYDVKPREVITHTSCQPDPIVFQRAGPPLIGRGLSGTYLARDGDLFTIKSASTGGVIIDVSSKVNPQPPARAASSP